MSVLRNLLYHPRRLWLRRALFQIHLWAGVFLSVYLVVIALSGSVLVYQDALTRWTLPAEQRALRTSSVVSPEAVMARFAQSQPGAVVSSLQFPSPQMPVFVLEGKTGHGQATRWYADPQTLTLHPAPRTWMDTVHDLHNFLLLPQAWGMQVNGVGAAVLLLLAATGMVLWWPGLRVWTRGLRVNLRGNWKRINFDLHNAVGFWTLLIVSWWAVSGVYFGWYRQVTAVVSAVSPVRGMAAPASAALPPSNVGEKVSLGRVVEAAHEVSPGRVWSVSNASLQGPECYVLMDLRAPGDFSHRDIVRVRAADARMISVWHYGERHTLGDWVLWSMHPLHFGTVWGPWVKALWAALGLSLAVLTITGLLMYWNRYLCKRWHALR